MLELAEEYRRLVIAILQRREAWQVVDSVSRIEDPAALSDLAGYAPYLSNDRKRELLETPDVAERLRGADRLDPRPRRGERGQRQDR